VTIINKLEPPVASLNPTSATARLGEYAHIHHIGLGKLARRLGEVAHLAWFGYRQVQACSKHACAESLSVSLLNRWASLLARSTDITYVLPHVDAPRH